MNHRLPTCLAELGVRKTVSVQTVSPLLCFCLSRLCLQRWHILDLGLHFLWMIVRAAGGKNRKRRFCLFNNRNDLIWRTAVNWVIWNLVESIGAGLQAPSASLMQWTHGSTPWGEYWGLKLLCLNLGKPSVVILHGWCSLWTDHDTVNWLPPSRGHAGQTKGLTPFIVSLAFQQQQGFFWEVSLCLSSEPVRSNFHLNHEFWPSLGVCFLFCLNRFISPFCWGILLKKHLCLWCTWC